VRTAIIWNARAGSAGEVDPESLRTRLGDDVEILEVGEQRSPAACARAALEGGAELVIAAGGDGTVSAVAAELVGQSARLGVLPLGTANSFAAALGIPADLDGALALLAERANERPLDIATVRGPAGDKTMVLHCSVGLHADVIGETSPAAKQRWGVLAYAASAVRKLAQLDTFAATIDTGDHVVRCRASAIAAANLAPIKSVLAHGPSHVLGDDGRVDITIIAAETIAEAIATGVHLWRTAREGEPATRETVGSLSAVRVTIETEPTQNVLVDGEPFGTTPVTIETRPRALRVIAPPAPQAEGPVVDASLIGLPELEIVPAG
jgi:YegS/Rv2252/BmrU family lipid kinase